MTPHPQYKGIALYSVVQDEDGYISNVPLCLCEHCDVNQFLCTKHISTATEREKVLDKVIEYMTTKGGFAVHKNASPTGKNVYTSAKQFYFSDFYEWITSIRSKKDGEN